MARTPRSNPPLSGNAPQASPVDDAERMDWEGGASHALPEDDRDATAIVPVEGPAGRSESALELHSALPFVLTTVAVGIAAIVLLRTERGRHLSRSVVDTATDWSDKLDRFARSMRSVLRTLENPTANHRADV